MARRKTAKPAHVVPAELPFLSKAEAASLARVGPRTIDSWIAGGRLPAFKIAGLQSVRIKRDDLLALFTPAPPLTPRSRAKAVA